ncbi:hypothetical protein GGX14DRAFT_414058 [Mycena pura]|uniref:AAA+ ATPase domain-containing protein n=1 Tax=Mycena pura TaxID=153505 RepID=A0AAD6YTP0_9AGAR|nr:hypothetical protein GGX14DRAFT_414058 [Mycena pura]
MVGRKKVAASATQSTKQKTLFDHFTKKVVVTPVSQTATSPQTTPVVAVDDENPIANTSRQQAPATPPIVYSSTEIFDITSPETTVQPLPIASSYVEIIDITGPEPVVPPSNPPSQTAEASSHSVVGPWNEESKSPDPVVIDLTSERPTTAPDAPKASLRFRNIFASRSQVEAPLPSTTARSQVPKHTYSIFNVRPKALSNPVSPSFTKKAAEAPFPTKEYQHIRGPQSIFSAPPYVKRSSKQEVKGPAENFRLPPDISADGVQPVLTLMKTPASSIWEKEQCIQTIPMDHKRNHPAIARISASTVSAPYASSEKLWTERWRPQRADGVLGNEDHAIYLRDWLRALEVRFENPASADSGQKDKDLDKARGAKRPQVMRSVSRAKKRRRMSSDDFDWIVTDASDYSSDVEGPADSEGDDDDFRSPVKPDDALDHAATSLFSDHLANTIILHGPSGSGKTTAVYSCAEELGWEVFEIHPGIGKRNGASLGTLVGEVGKNHLVRGTQGRFSHKRNGEDGTEDDFGFVTPKLTAGTRQSVILLEEVDILFREDANFWPTVIKLIGDCKRAVVCTCNDISLVPVDELPLQTILEFRPCPSGVAGSYLQGLCCAEGHIVDRDTLINLYAPGFDLRHTIHRLQLLCQGFPLRSRPESEHLLNWNVAPQKSVPHADIISFTDAYMTRDSVGRPQALAATHYEPSADDEIGYPILADTLSDSVYEWDTKITSAVLAISRGTSVACADWDFRATVDYQDLIDALRNNPTFPVGMIQREEFHTDYLPCVRQIIAAEDAVDAAWQGLAGRRGTRSSRRYLRTVEVGGEERDLLSGSSL